MKRAEWYGVALGGALLVAAGVYGFAHTAHSAEADAGTIEPPPAAPNDLLAELYVGSPNATWTKLQRGIGGPMGILPATMPGVVVALADLDAALTSELDGTSPIYAALAGDPSDPAWAVALKLNDERHARGVLVDGDTARYDGKAIAPGMTLLAPKKAASVGEESRAAAITSNGWLLIARRASDLAGLGAYVARALPVRPAPADNASILLDLPRAALANGWAPKLGALWSQAKDYLLGEDARMRKERGRAPDFGDPAAIVAALDAAVTRRLGIAGDLDHVHVGLDVTTDAASLVATLSPQRADAGAAAGWVDEMRTGEAAALAMPSTSVVALSMRDDAPARVDEAKALEGLLASALGPRLKDPVPMNAVIDLATSARDESFALAWTSDEPSGVVLQAPVRDDAAAEKALGTAVDLAKTEPFVALVGVPALTAGEVTTAMFTRADGKAKPIGLAWQVSEHVLYAAVGHEPAATLKLKPARKLADEPALASFVGAIGADASTVVIAQPFGAKPAAPVTFAIGKRGADAFVRLDVPDAVLREAARRELGF